MYKIDSKTEKNNTIKPPFAPISLNQEMILTVCKQFQIEKYSPFLMV